MTFVEITNSFPKEIPRVTAPLPSATPSQKDSAKPIILVSYPKIVLLYPTYIAAFIAGILSLFLTVESPHSRVIGMVFLVILGVNMVVLSFDFPRTTSLNLFFVFLVMFVVSLVLGSRSRRDTI